MDQPEQVSTVSSLDRYWWAEAWAGARPRFIGISTELIVSVGLLLALGVFYLVLRFLVLVAGVPVEEVDFLKRVDLWAVRAVFLTFSIAFVIQLAIGAYASGKNAWDSTKEKS
jgi:hypothetical protein